MTTRRDFLTGILAAGFAPAIGHAGILMPVRQIAVPPSDWVDDAFQYLYNDGMGRDYTFGFWFRPEKGSAMERKLARMSSDWTVAYSMGTDGQLVVHRQAAAVADGSISRTVK